MKLSVPRVVVSIVVLVVVGAACRPIKKPGTPAALRLFPSNALTVPDASQATGLRMNLPKPNCVVRKSDCAEINLINQLDGFDLDPTISIGFAGSPINVARVTDGTVFVQNVIGGPRIGLNRLVRDQATNTLYGHPKEQLRPHSQYRLVVTRGVNGQAGETKFTTMSATDGLTKMVAQLEGMAAPTLQIEKDSDNNDAVYPSATVVPGGAMNRTNDTGSGHTQTEQVFDSSPDATVVNATYVFGHFDAQQWLDLTTRTMPTPPTAGSFPGPARTEPVGFALITPGAPCVMPTSPAGWPVAIFGPGVTRSKYDVFLASDENLRKCIATIAIDPVGHGYGPSSKVTITRTVPLGGNVDVHSYGRGVDVNGDGTIGDREGVQTKAQPDPNAAIALRDGLRQTALDNMSLVRAIEAGFTIPLATGNQTLSTTDIKYYAQSLGGIYGTMVMATDPDLTVGALDVPGGPILEIARLSPGFRSEVGIELSHRVPPLYSCTPNPPSNSNCTTFKEQTPLYLHPPVTLVSASAIAIQQVGARTNWINRLGSPETYAPLLTPSPTNPKKVIYQFAYGDQTVPNPTNATIMRAGKLQSVTSYYRYNNDPASAQRCNPHGFLLDPRVSATGRTQGQLQIATFFDSDGATILDPDAAGPIWEVPISSTNKIESNNFATPPPKPLGACGSLSFGP
jgi:hypothetical protein